MKRLREVLIQQYTHLDASALQGADVSILNNMLTVVFDLVLKFLIF